MVSPYRIFTAVGTALILLFAAFQPARAAQDEAFTVRGVQVDVTAASATDAREQAFSQAQQLAFRRLAERLLSESEMATFRMPDTGLIATMINDFEITSEQLSSVQYIASYTFRFRKDAVSGFLGGSGLSYTDVSSKPVLILPFYEWGSRTVLWGNDNPWLAAWTKAEAPQGLVPVTVPIGDIQDVSDMDDGQALTYNADNLSRMVERYGAGEAVIVIASPLWAADQSETQIPATLRVAVYRTGRGNPYLERELKIDAAPDDSAATLLDRAVRETQKTLLVSWKDKTSVSTAQDNSLKARVRFSSMEEWIETQKKLRRVQGVHNVQLLSLKPQQADVALAFQGTEERLRLALSQADMTLTTPALNFGGGGIAPLVYDLYLNKFAPR